MKELKFRLWESELKSMITDENSDQFLIALDGRVFDAGFTFSHQSEYCKDMVVMQSTGLKDKNGFDIYEGDIVEYYDLYECHSDAVDYYDVEPQNNFPVSEVYPEVKFGQVEYCMGAYMVDSIDISHLNFLLSSKINECFFMGNLGCSTRDFIALCHDLGFSSPIRGNSEVKVIGNIYENPELIGDL